MPVARNRYKLSPEQVAEAFERLDQDEPLKAIAIDFGVHVTTLARTLYRAELYGFAMWEGAGKYESFDQTYRGLRHESKL